MSETLDEFPIFPKMSSKDYELVSENYQTSLKKQLKKSFIFSNKWFWIWPQVTVVLSKSTSGTRITGQSQPQKQHMTGNSRLKIKIKVICAITSTKLWFIYTPLFPILSEVSLSQYFDFLWFWRSAGSRGGATPQLW